MKIVYLLATEKGWGGLEKHVFDVASAMVERGHHVTVLCSDFYQQECPPGIYIEAFDWSGARRNPFTWYRLKKVLRRLAPDVVHAQADKAAYILSKAGWPTQCLAVGTVHNIKSGYGSYSKLDALIAVSGMISEQLDHPDVTVVHNGVVDAKPDAAVSEKLNEWLQNKPSPVFLSIGRLVPAKGFDVLLQAWPSDQGGTLVVLGEGKERARLEQLIEERGLKNVYLLGESTHVREWISLASLLLISSRNEGGPYVLSEALMSGLAVIGTRVGMVPDFLPDQNLIPPGDVDSLNRLLVEALNNPSQFHKNCEKAFVEARSCLSVDSMMSSVEAIYFERLKN